MLPKDRLRNQWEGKAFRNYGRSTKLTSLYTAMCTTTKGVAPFIRYAKNSTLYLAVTDILTFDSKLDCHCISLWQNICTSKEKHNYKGNLNGTIHVVAGGGGASLATFAPVQTEWSIFKDYDYGFVKLTAFDRSNLLFEYKKSRDGKVYDSFRISREYKDILACSVDSCPSTTLAS